MHRTFIPPWRSKLNRSTQQEMQLSYFPLDFGVCLNFYISISASWFVGELSIKRLYHTVCDELLLLRAGSAHSHLHCIVLKLLLSYIFSLPLTTSNISITPSLPVAEQFQPLSLAGAGQSLVNSGIFGGGGLVLTNKHCMSVTEIGSVKALHCGFSDNNNNVERRIRSRRSRCFCLVFTPAALCWWAKK